MHNYLNRLSSISSSPSNSFIYEYNAANQRTLNRLWDGSYWRYGYDELGQVISGKKYWSDLTLVAAQQFGYAFDDIGNRTQTATGADQTGANFRVTHYTNNTLNQITGRNVPAYVDITGDAFSTNTVTVNTTGRQIVYRKGEYFWYPLAVTNTSAAVWQGVTVYATGQTSVSGNAYVAETPETFSYDADGNLTQDGRWNYTWDGENRLINMTSLSGAPSGSKLELVFTYDYQGRRIQKIVSTNYSSSYYGEYTNNYAYDGWNLVAEVTPGGSLIRSYLWGTDLSGSMQGAGGVGGLLEVAYYGAGTTNCFVSHDGNGNVSALFNAANGIILANYEYGPFGEAIRASGPMAKLNPVNWSDKIGDPETGLIYYGYRYYNPSTGRWLSRDPIEEKGGLNLYANVGNNAINSIDPDGRLWDWLKKICGCAVDKAKDKAKGKLTEKEFNWILNTLGKDAATHAQEACDWLKCNTLAKTSPAQWNPRCSQCAAYNCAKSSLNGLAFKSCMEAAEIDCNAGVDPNQ